MAIAAAAMLVSACASTRYDTSIPSTPTSETPTTLPSGPAAVLLPRLVDEAGKLSPAITAASGKSEIAASIQEEAFDYLDAPVARITAAHAPIPHAPQLMEALLPQVETVVDTVKRSIERWPPTEGGV